MDRPVRQIAILAGVVYFTQGALGIAGIALPLYLRNLGWSVSKIAAVSSIAAFPWIFKIIYGLLSDSFPIFGFRRKSYLVICSFISSLGWFLLVVLPPDLIWIGCAMTLSNLGFAAVDVVTDGLIVEHSRGPLNSFFQSIAWGTRSAGALLSGVAGGWLAYHWKHENVFLLTMFLPLLVIFCTPLIKEVKHERAPFSSFKEPFLRCWNLMGLGSMRWYLGVLLSLSVGSTFGVPFFFYLKETLGFKETFMGLLTSLGWTGAMAGSWLYFGLLRKVEQVKLLRVAIWVNAVNIFTTLLIHHAWSAMILITLGGMMGCISMLTIMTASAALTHRSGVEGTFFAILMGIFNLGQILFGFMGSKLYARIGLMPLIVVTGFVALSGLYWVSKMRFEKNPAAS